MKEVHIIYRFSRYGKWQPMTVKVPAKTSLTTCNDEIRNQIKKKLKETPLEWKFNNRIK